MYELLADLLGNTGALGVWLLGPGVVVDNQHHAEVIAGAVKQPSVKPPVMVWIEGETHIDFGERQVFAQRIGAATLVVVFDDGASLGLIRLRVRHARDAIERALAERRHD
jgi:hypothetical protein